MKYQPIIGLEIHVELNTRSKMFCDCLNNPNECHPNVNICPICTAQPGTLPVINKEAVRKTIKTGLALNCQIPEYSKFERKNYFYPDLPKGYQISQYAAPFCKNGFLEINGSPEGKPSASNGVKKIRIREVHLEEDTGSLIHEKNYSLVDFNRAGIPLMELVTEPDLRSAKEARKFAEELQLILRYLNVSNADMEKGEMRVEANISLRESGIKNKELGTKVEIKNLNSFKALEKAIDYEIERQSKLLALGEKVIQETKGWDDVKGVTISQREKEESQDYRYFPEPDLPSLSISQNLIDEIKSEIPELPQQKRERFKKEYNLSAQEIEIFIQARALSNYFEKAISELGQWLKEIKPEPKKESYFHLIKVCSNYLLTDLRGLLKGASVRPPKFLKKTWEGKDFFTPLEKESLTGLITPENFAEFIILIYEGKISSPIAKMVLTEMFSTGADPSHIIEEKGLVQITDESALEKIVKEVILRNQKAVQDFKKGKANALQFLIGQVIQETGGKANPDIVHNLLNKLMATAGNV
ncbi:Asp-tRNA(Asn)/Glu-tRNA(Gln) amidotransferase subunit GatB [Patescibacteria group bacterium]|nr:Asp-tRNA(Asn)/Glu-tRNA(Gln) amidotransferase subunit GatB [Patescibacteria group bacterium]MBU4481152.1 Asp-tRNA(Asn)/Glu-tRNA(Gln) amidotransferase subunit GatB [Patescibacteria group bacterium]